MKVALRTTLTMLVLGAMGLLAVEAAVRVRQWIILGRTGPIDDTLTIDPESGLRELVANFDHGRVRINALGFRSPELVQPKPAGLLRLAFLGGSTTYCAEVSGNEMTWPHLVWQSLRAALPAVRFDYLNAGVPGYRLEAIQRNFTQRVQRLQPDVVVL